MVKAKSAAQIDRTLAALADPNRRAAVQALRRGPLRAGELAERMQLSPAAMSRHLRVLRTAGIVEESHPEFDARVRIYALNPRPIAALRAWLEETEALWSTQLAALKTHLEKKE